MVLCMGVYTDPWRDWLSRYGFLPSPPTIIPFLLYMRSKRPFSVFVFLGFCLVCLALWVWVLGLSVSLVFSLHGFDLWVCSLSFAQNFNIMEKISYRFNYFFTFKRFFVHFNEYIFLLLHIYAI